MILFLGNDVLDQVVQVMLGTAMFVGGLIGFLLDNTVPGKTLSLSWINLSEDQWNMRTLHCAFWLKHACSFFIIWHIQCSVILSVKCVCFDKAVQ